MTKRTKSKSPAETNVPIAIVGLSALCPGDGTTDGFLRVIFNGEDWIEDVPPSRFALADFHDPDPASKADKTYCKRGAFIRPVAFDPMEYGIPPSALPATDSSQLLALLKTTEALADAATHRWDSLDRERISVIVGAQGMTYLQARMMARMNRPEWVEEMRTSGMSDGDAETTADNILARHPAWQELSFPGFLGNIIAGRVTNRMDLGGSNYIVDAACASSLAAMSAALNELLLGQCDLVLTGGVDLLSDIGSYVAFSKTMALSRTGDCKPFSKDADGTIIGEGVVMFAMRRLADAERDRDQIYGVIRGHGTSSDGRGSAIYAPRKEGQLRAMRRAYKAAGYSPETVGLVEAHGTGTPLGDAIEVESMSEIFAGPDRREPCALGSVKSQIGHAKTAAGAASLFKVVSALQHKVLPPTLKSREPNPALLKDGCPLYLNPQTRPWISGADHPRRASLSAFGFGGTNAHITVEEYAGEGNKASRRMRFPSQLVLLSGDTLESVLAAGRECAARVEQGASLDGVARQSHERFSRAAPHRLSIVATDAADLKAKLDKTATFLARMNALPESGVDGVAYSNAPAAAGKIAFLFPGQGSQYVAMTAGLAIHFDAAREVWDEDARRTRETGETPLHEIVFPPHDATDDGRSAQELKLRSTDMAQPGLALASLSQLAVLKALGLAPDMAAGHSFGEIMALHAAGAFDAETALAIARRRGALMRSAGAGVKAAMTAITLDLASVEAKIKDTGASVSIANHNAPNQVVISGLEEEIAKVEKTLSADAFKRLPVSSAFHSPIVSACADEFRAFLNATEMSAPALPVYANTTAAPYGAAVKANRDTLAKQIASTVRFADCVRAMHDAGARIFVEVGPGSVLTRLTDQCLGDLPHTAVALDSTRQDSVTALLKGLGRLSVAGVNLNLGALWDNRRTGAAQAPAALKKHIVWVDSTMNRLTEGDRLAGKTSARPARAVAKATAPAASKANGVHPDGAPGPDLTIARGKSNGLSITPPRPAERADNVHGWGAENSMHDVESKTVPATPALAARRSIEPREISSPRLTLVKPAAANNGPMAFDMQRFEVAHRHAAVAQENYLDTISEAHHAFLDLMQDAFRAIGAEAPAYSEASAVSHSARAPMAPQPLAQPKAYESPPPRANAPAQVRNEPDALADKEPAAMVHAVSEPAPASARTEPAKPATASGAVNAIDIVGVVLDVIAQKTGYPEDMLDDGLELEGDLGIDSIKRVEIFVALSERAQLGEKPSDADRAKIGGLKTIGDVIDFLQERAAASGATAPATPVAAPPVSAPQAAAAAPAIDIERTVLGLIAEKTGYPEDMLDAEMELEGDLGIDSIRRVEIFMALRDRVPGLPEAKEADRAKIGALKTIGDVTGYLRAATSRTKAPAADPSVLSNLNGANVMHYPASPAAEAAPRHERAQANAEPALDRFVVGVVAVPRRGEAMAKLSKSAPVCITPDEHGVATALANGFRARGFAARVGAEVGADAGTVIFLGGLSDASDPQTAVTVHESAFLAAKAAAPRFSKAGGVFVTVQDTGGTFGYDTDPGERAWLGGLSGVAKTIAKCWPDVEVKAIDIARGSRSAEAVAAALLEEIFDGGPEIEVGLSASGLRCAPKMTPSSLGVSASSGKMLAPIDNHSVILVSGGSRGVTAPCLEAIARAHRPRFVILGRTPMSEEPDGLAAAVTESELKVALLALARAAGESPKPAEIGRAASAILSTRSARACIARLGELGSEAQYLAIDIRDPAALEAGLAQVRKAWGPITGLIHAAGVLIDKLIVDKTPEQFASVFETKVLGLANLLEATRSDPLKMMCFFSSVSAQFGNIGQIDYSSANEVLNKVALAQARKRQGKCLVRSINWGAWDGGMISPEVGRMLKSVSVSLISLEAGAAFCQRELASPHMYPEEVVALHRSDLAPFAGPPGRQTRLFDLVQASAQAAE